MLGSAAVIRAATSLHLSTVGSTWIVWPLMVKSPVVMGVVRPALANTMLLSTLPKPSATTGLPITAPPVSIEAVAILFTLTVKVPLAASAVALAVAMVTALLVVERALIELLISSDLSVDWNELTLARMSW